MYIITPNGAGADLNYGKGGDLFANIWLSLEIVQGSWWFNPGFGLKQRRRMKNTPATAALLKQDCQSALQWLLDNKRAVSVVVTPMAVPENRFRLRMLCDVTAATGETASYSKFVEVV
jgi:phage gp46-like protein